MPSVKLIAALVVFTFGRPSAHTCLAQGTTCISVRALNENNGKPVKDVQVSMFVPPPATEIEMGRTSKQGIVTHCFREPLPKVFALQYYEFSGPDENGYFKTEDVLKQGVLAPHPPNGPKFKGKVTPKQGEVVVFGARWWLIDRWLGPWP